MCPYFIIGYLTMEFNIIAFQAHSLGKFGRYLGIFSLSHIDI